MDKIIKNGKVSKTKLAKSGKSLKNKPAKSGKSYWLFMPIGTVLFGNRFAQCYK